MNERSRSGLLLVLLLSALIGNVQAQGKANAGKPSAQPVQPVDVTEITRWAVSYRDTQLGGLHGSAYVNWAAERTIGPSHTTERVGHARVVMDGASGNKQFVANKFEFVHSSTNSITTDLEGVAPAAPATKLPDISKYPAITAGEGETAKISLGGFETKFTVRDKAAAELGHMHVSLAQTNFGFLLGSWTYLSDPLTQRDKNGQGAVGAFRMLSKKEIANLNDENETDVKNGGFLGVQHGSTVWTPLPTRIADIVPVEDQLEYKNGVARYAAPSKNHWHSEEARHRTLLVIGRNLPVDLGKALAPIDSDQLAVREAHVIATSQDQNLSAADRLLFDKGWNQILSELAAKGHKTTREDASRGMDQVLIAVTLKDDAFAGPKRFSWGGSHFPWLLQYGDNTVVSYLVRPLREGKLADENENEAASEFYLPERVAFEVRVRNAVPLDTIPIKAGTSSGKPQALLAHRQPDDPTLYRTDFFEIGSGGFAAGNGDALEAAIDQQKLLTAKKFQFVAVPLIKAALRRTPASEQSGRLGGLWKEALVQAAKADGLPFDNMDALPGKPAGKILPQQSPIYGGFPAQPGTFGNVHVLVRDQAAMLLLRDAYLITMEKQLAWLQHIKSDSDLEKFREWIRPFVLYEPAAYFGQPQAPYGPSGYVKYPSFLNLIPDSQKDAALKGIDDLNTQLGLMARMFKAIPGAVLNPSGGQNIASVSAFGRMAVTGLDGSQTTLYATFASENRDVASMDGPDWYRAEKLRLWHAQTMREALATYEKAVAAAIDAASPKAILDSDVPGLLKLTGMSFGPIVKQLLPQLMTLRDGIGAKGALWVPDTSGRAAILSLHITAEAVRGQQDYSSIKDQYALLAVTGLLAVPAMVSEGALGSIVTLAGNTLLWTDNSVQEILETHHGQQDVEFEFGSALVLGPERLAEAEIRKTEWYQTFLSVAGQSLLNVAMPAVYDTLPKIALENAAIRGERILLELRSGSAAAVRALAPGASADLLAFEEVAFLKDAEVAPLSAADVKGMSEAETLNYEARGPPSVRNETEVLPQFSVEEQAAADETLAKTKASPVRSLADPGPADTPQVQNPAPKGWVEVKEGGESVEFKLSGLLGEGGSSEVYEILDVRGRDQSYLTKRKVIKFITNDTTLGAPKVQMARMKLANDLLKKTRGTAHPIEFSEILEFHPEASRPYFIQELVERGPEMVLINPEKLMQRIYNGPFRVGVPLPFEELCKVFPREMQDGVARLMRDLGLNGLAGTDISFKNIYFKKVGNEWIAGILDVDFVVHEGAFDASNKTWTWLTDIKMNPPQAGIQSIAWDGRPLKSAAAFNEKMLEARYAGNIKNSWIFFNEETGLFEPILMDPAIAKKYFPLMGTRPEGFRPLPKAPLPDE